MKSIEIFEKYSHKLDKSEGPLVSIITTSYRNEKFNEKYFDSIDKQTYKNIEIIFVDSASPDNTVKEAKTLIKRGKIVVSKDNIGCPAGLNLAAKESLGKYVCVVGPDVWLDKDCIRLLVESAEKKEGAIYVPWQMSYDGKIFLSCGIAADLFGYPERAYTPDGKKQVRKIFSADNGIFLTRKNYIKLGMMDEEHFLFAEDVDLSWKAHLLGMSVIPIPESILYHFSGGSVGIGGFPKGGKYQTTTSRRYLAERNIIRNILKNYRWWNIIWVLPYYMLINIAEMFALIFSGQARTITETYIKAYIWNIKNYKSMLKKRRHIQRIRTVGDFKVMELMSKVPGKFYALLELGIPKVSS
ncbi:glycosyltransferase [Patescibacteria group bacterium]|nr:glycosyltransferase [Patescibacteria group bacterium]